VNAQLKVPTDKPLIAVYIRPGYKAKLKELANLNNPRRPSLSDTAARLLEEAIDRLIQEEVLKPISDKDESSDLR
jgi:hypothetical protein